MSGKVVIMVPGLAMRPCYGSDSLVILIFTLTKRVEVLIEVNIIKKEERDIEENI